MNWKTKAFYTFCITTAFVTNSLKSDLDIFLLSIKVVIHLYMHSFFWFMYFLLQMFNILVLTLLYILFWSQLSHITVLLLQSTYHGWGGGLYKIHQLSIIYYGVRVFN